MNLQGTGGYREYAFDGVPVFMLNLGLKISCGGAMLL
jgi:hypothetical protein